MTTILKLGGSVITQKEQPETVDETTLMRLAEAVAGYDDLVLVHGAGSFGHHQANKHDVSTTAGTREAGAVRAIHDAMKQLNDVVVDALADQGALAVPIHPLSVAARNAEGRLTFPVDATNRLLNEGFLPVLHGDVIGHEGRGATILSGDEIVVTLADSLEADRIGLCSAVPGVLNDRNEVVPRVESFDDVAPYVSGSDATDVTGGMAGKLRQLLTLDVPAFIFGVDAVGPFLNGADVGTRVD